MGNSSYNSSSRFTRASASGTFINSINENFTQNQKRKIHESMSPKGLLFRECRDSEAHPNAIPIQLYLDVTGSMGHIPQEMIKTGLPTLMGSLIQNGVPDAALMFGAIGDHECDQYPLQIAQFESGDAELDMWLTRSFLEGGGGGNGGESYLLAWYIAANHIKTDAFDKRKQKGFVFTIGDEPCLKNLPVTAIKGLLGDTVIGEGNYSREELLAKAQEQNHVYHIHVNHGGHGCDPGWREMLGKNLIEIEDHTKIARVLSDIIIEQNINASPAKDKPKSDDKKSDEITAIL